MERILKILLISILVVQPIAFANEQAGQPSETTQTVRPEVDFSTCIKTYPVGVEKLIFSTLSCANELGYQIKEIQTKSGYIIFETGYRKFLASVIYVSSTKSMLKITPYSGNYDFPQEVVTRLFNCIENDVNKAQADTKPNE